MNIFVVIGVISILIIWFGLMTSWAYNAYYQIRYEYKDLGFISLYFFLLMFGVTCLVIGLNA